MNISVANSALIEHNGHFKTKVTILSHFTHIFMKEADLRLLTTMQLAIYCLLKVRKPPLKTSEALLGPVSSINGTKRLFFCIFCVKFLKTINLFVVGSMLTDINDFFKLRVYTSTRNVHWFVHPSVSLSLKQILVN